MYFLDHRKKPKVIWSFIRWKKYRNVQRHLPKFATESSKISDEIFKTQGFPLNLQKLTVKSSKYKGFPWNIISTLLYFFHRRKLQITLGFFLWSRKSMLLTDNHSEHPHSLRLQCSARKFRVFENFGVYCMTLSYSLVFF